jgi:SAM-dependent methyltransferase
MRDKGEKSKSEKDAFSGIDYRKIVSWSKRIERESPFLIEVLERTPARSVLDLGCGTGEHSRFIARLGFQVLGIDRSESMLAKAMDSDLPANLEFIHGDIQDLASIGSKKFGTAISLGNTLVSVLNQEAMQWVFQQVAQRIVSGGFLVFQILNYTRIKSQKIRNLPLNFTMEECGQENIFLRIMKCHEDGSVDFYPTTLSLDPTRQNPIQVLQSSLVHLHGWTLDELEPLLHNAGFRIENCYGDMQKGIFDEFNSPDLVVVAQNR